MVNMKKITTAIIPVAGYGTRRLPIAKTIEKCMLPIGNRPIIDYVVADCIAAGITEIWFVVGEESTQIREYFGRNEKLEEYLRIHKKTDKLKQIQPIKNVNFHYVTQSRNDKYGTTIPVALALKEIATNRRINVENLSESILVVMGDDFLYYHDEKLSKNATRMEIIAEHSDFKKMLANTNEEEAAMLGVRIPLQKVSEYGVISLDEKQNFREIVEKPAPENAPSDLINVSKYVFPPRLSKLVVKSAQDENSMHEGEYPIIDPINDFVREGGIMKIIPAKGEYLDGGSLAGWLYANEVVGRDLLAKG